MESVGQAFAGWTVTHPAALIVLLSCLALLYLFAARARAGWTYDLRRIGGLEAIKEAAGQAAELGMPMHMALGNGGIGGLTTLETLAGMTTLEYLAQQAALCDTSLIVNVADPTTLPAAQEALYRGYAQAGYLDEYDSTYVRFLAPDPVAYAAGVMAALNQEKLAANVMIGTFGDEFLLMGETGTRKTSSQVAGTTSPKTLSYMYATVNHVLIGEEIFAAGAYLQGNPNHVGGLVTQDVLRTAIVFTVILGELLHAMGWM